MVLARWLRLEYSRFIIALPLPKYLMNISMGKGSGNHLKGSRSIATVMMHARLLCNFRFNELLR
jgi:hypothetical protein